jgi:DNA-binding transcriptional regulator of glucitol operon
LQNLLGYLFQVRQYQKVIQKWLGRGILGVGQRRGLFAFGELLVLVYNFREDKVITVQSLRGYSIFARFAELPGFAGLSLEELRRRAAGAGRRKTLVQAIEAVEKHLRASPAAAPETVIEPTAETAIEPTAKAKSTETAAKPAKAAETATKPTTKAKPTKTATKPVKAAKARKTKSKAAPQLFDGVE